MIRRAWPRCCASALAALAGLALGAGCVSTNYNLATQHQDITITSTGKEVEIGRKIAQRVEASLKVAADVPVQDRVRAIGDKLVAVCDRQEIIYSFTVVEDDDVNAFSLPGGYIFVHTGLIKAMANDDELAAVLAHEIGHVAARHAIRQYETSLGSQLASAATVLGGAGPGVAVALQATRLAYSRQDELGADRLAVKYMPLAGYDPKAILSVLKTLRKESRKKLHYMPRGIIRPQYALTHPFVPERIRAVKETLFGVADYVDYLNTPANP